MATIVELAWAAGIVDGEGCISIVRVPAGRQKGCTTDRFTLNFKVTMGHRPTVARLLDILAIGTVQAHVARSDKVNASFSYIAQSQKAATVIRLLLPYLVTKAEEAAVALQFMEIPKADLGGRGGGLSTLPSIADRRLELYWKLRQLKPRWRFSKEANSA